MVHIENPNHTLSSYVSVRNTGSNTVHRLLQAYIVSEKLENLSRAHATLCFIGFPSTDVFSGECVEFESNRARMESMVIGE